MPGAGTLGARRIGTRARAQRRQLTTAKTSGKTRTPGAVNKPKPRAKPAPRPKPRPAPKVAPAPRASTRGFSAPSGPSPAERRASRERQRAEQARQRQLAAMRKSIKAQPLDPALIASFAERERLAKRGVSQAESFSQRGKEQSETDFQQFLAQLGQQTDDARFGLRGEAAARNLAFQPMFVGVGMRDIRDRAAEAQTQAESQRAQFLAGLQRQVQQAQQQKAEEMAAIARERARAQADHQRFIDMQLAALR